MTRSIALSLILLPAQGAELLREFQPSSASSPHGKVSVVEFETPLHEVEAGALALHLPGAMMNFEFAESVWVIGYKTWILDAQGKPPRDNYLCHTFLGDQRMMQTGDQEVRGLYSDSFTREVHLPEGTAVRVLAGEPLHWMPMFNNRAADSVRVKMRVELSVIRDKDVASAPRELYSTLRSVATPHLYFVKPGRDARSAEFELPGADRIYFMGTHIHPYGSSVELYNVTRGERVWLGKSHHDAKGDMTGMDVFSSAPGYTVRNGDKFRVTAVYDNPTRTPIDAMAGLYILYSPKAQPGAASRNH
ncbi:MAG: hypothetical protein U0Q16_05385 [Bryobacteraceae bacterium]